MAYQNYDEALLDHRKKTHILQIVSILQYTMLYLVDSIFVSNLESHFEKIEKTKIGIAPNFVPWKKIGKKANHIVEIIS